MTEKELNELWKLVEAEKTTMPWTVKPLLGQFVIKAKDGKPVQATAARCRLIELALQTLGEPAKIAHTLTRAEQPLPSKEEMPQTRRRGRSHEDRSNTSFTGHSHSDADLARSDEL